jgi:quercetin dioxygenase-like cupin family protein
MRRRFAVAAVVLVAMGGGALHASQAQAPGVRREDVLRSDIGVRGREVVQARVIVAPGVLAPRHSHPGEEVAYVLTGQLRYQIDGRPPVTLGPGEALFIPAGAIHSARNVGDVEAVELATYVVRKGRPLVVPAR